MNKMNKLTLVLGLLLVPFGAFGQQRVANSQKQVASAVKANGESAPVADGNKYSLGIGDYGIAASYDVNEKVTIYATAGSNWSNHSAAASAWYRVNNRERSDWYLFGRVYVGGGASVGAGAGLEWAWGKVFNTHSNFVKHLYSNWDLGYATGQGVEVSGSLRYRFGK